MTQYTQGQCFKLEVSKDGYYPQVDYVVMTKSRNLTKELSTNPTHTLEYEEGGKTANITSSVAEATITAEQISENVVGLDLENIPAYASIKYTIADDNDLITNRESYFVYGGEEPEVPPTENFDYTKPRYTLKNSDGTDITVTNDYLTDFTVQRSAEISIPDEYVGKTNTDKMVLQLHINMNSWANGYPRIFQNNNDTASTDSYIFLQWKEDEGLVLCSNTNSFTLIHKDDDIQALLGQDIWIRFISKKSKGKTVVYYSTDGTNFIKSGEYNVFTYIDYATLNLGCRYGDTNWNLTHFDGKIYSSGSYLKVNNQVVWQMYENKDTYTITFDVTPADATIKYKLNGGAEQTLSGNTLEANIGDNIAYEFSKSGYETYTNTLTVSKSETISYTLQEEVESNTVYDSKGTAHNDTEVVDDGSYNFTSAYSKNTSVTGALNFNSLTTCTCSQFFGNSFKNNTNITKVKFPVLTSIASSTFAMAFSSCTNIEEIYFPELTAIVIGGFRQAFQNCSKISSVSFPKLTSVTTGGLQNTFYNCSSITHIDFPLLESIKKTGDSGTMQGTFTGCNITGEITFPKLKEVTGSNTCYETFKGNTAITKVYFPKLETLDSGAFKYIFRDCTGITEVHFPVSLSGNSECTIENMGCANATVYFDL